MDKYPECMSREVNLKMVIPDGLHPGQSTIGDLSDNLYDADNNLVARGALYLPPEEDSADAELVDTLVKVAVGAGSVLLIAGAKWTYDKVQPKVSSWWRGRHSGAEQCVSTDIAESASVDSAMMTAEEARARLMEAVRAKAYSDMQVAYVAHALILDEDGVSIPCELDQDQLIELVNDLAHDSRMLEWPGFANLLSLVDVQHATELEPAARQLLTR